jgi:hypothetical protein
MKPFRNFSLPVTCLDIEVLPQAWLSIQGLFHDLYSCMISSASQLVHDLYRSSGSGVASNITAGSDGWSVEATIGFASQVSAVCLILKVHLRNNERTRILKRVNR